MTDDHTGAADGPPVVRLRRLPRPVAPVAAETLFSYLSRLEKANYLAPSTLQRQICGPNDLSMLSQLSGYPEIHLFSALPGLQTNRLIRTWPHLQGAVSARAGVRPACIVCAIRKTAAPEQRVDVHASHEQVLCCKHRRWVGADSLKCGWEEQFSVAACPEVLKANAKHRKLIAAWGLGAVLTAFRDSIVCLSTWSRWPVTRRDPAIARRWTALGVTEDMRPKSPRETAAWYPNAVELAALILEQARDVDAAGGMTAKIAACGAARLSSQIIDGLVTGGAGDPYRQAILNNATVPTLEGLWLPELNSALLGLTTRSRGSRPPNRETPDQPSGP